MLGECWDRCASGGLAREDPVIGADLVRLALAAGDAARARDVTAAVAGVASRNEVPWITGAALRCEGLVEDDARILDAAVTAYACGERPLELALTCEDAGAAFARQGNVDRAGQLLDRAIIIYERLDAARGLARAEAALRQMGIRRGRHVTHRCAQSGWLSLTPTSGPSWTWSPRDCPTPRSACACTSHAGPCKPISHTCSPSFTSPPAPSSLPRRFGTGGNKSGERERPGRHLSLGAGGRTPVPPSSRLARDGGTPAWRPGPLSRDLPRSAPVSAPTTGALTDRDISQRADACQAGAAAP
jgi:hypothetical protein